MKFLKLGIAFLIVAVAAFFTWNYFDGPMKMRRDMYTYADSVARCEPLSQTVKVPRTGGVTLDRSVDGLVDGLCQIQMDGLGSPNPMRCRFAPEDLPVIAEGFAGLAEQVGIFGGIHYKYSSSDPDPLTVAFNSDACETVVE